MHDTPTASMKRDQDDWRGESDHRTLTDAAAIGSDPQRMRGVAKHHRKVQKGLKRVGAMIQRPR